MDDRQAREAAVAAMEDHYDRWSGPGEEPPTYEDLANAAIDAYLAALPVAPEQPTQANEDHVRKIADAVLAEEVAQLRAMLTTPGLGLTNEAHWHIGWLADTLDERQGVQRDDIAAALVSSPSVETVTPDRETRIESLLRLSDDAAEAKFGSRPNGTAKQNGWCPSCRANNHAHEYPSGACPRCACDVRVYFEVSS